MSTDRATARITLESLDEPKALPVVGWNSRNVWFVLGFAALGYGIAQFFGFGLAGMTIIMAVTTYIGYDIVRSAPPYCNVTDWIQTNIRYWRRPTKYANVAEAHLETESSIRAAIETPETTRDMIHIKRFYPPHGIIERDDGTYSMVLRYTPPNMDFSTDSEYLQLMDTLADGYNKTIDFDVTIHTTTRPVDMEAYFEQLAERMDDPDVQNNEIFKALLQEMKEDRRQMLEQSDTEIVHFYFIISVDPDEVEDTVGGDDDASQRSWLFRLLGRGSDDDEDEDMAQDRRLKKKLDKRASTVQNLVAGGGVLEDASIDRVSTTEAAAVLESYWTGKDVPLDADVVADPVPLSKTTVRPRAEDVDVKDVAEVDNE